MPLQDLTPQLRTRLSRVERAVGFFVTAATVLLLAGFGYYIYHTAQRKGWYKTKIYYSTSLNNAAGLKAGDSVKLMGFNVGEITEVRPNDPGDYYGVTVYFRIQEPNYGYIWLDSKVRVAAADFLGNRSIEVLKGYNGAPTVLETESKEAIGVLQRDEVKKLYETTYAQMFAAALEAAKQENPTFNEHALRMEATLETQQQITNRLNQIIRENPSRFYVDLKTAKPYWIEPLESPALTERLETLVNTVETALPNILSLTNSLAGVLTNAQTTTARLNLLLAEARPTLTNLAVITENLRDPQGSLGNWLLPTNLHTQLDATVESARNAIDAAQKTLETANVTLQHTDTNITTLVSNLNLSLENLANLTSNLNAQVQSNTNIVGEISRAIVHTDELVQGLKRHWLLRSAFKDENKKDKSPADRSRRPVEPLRSPKDTP